MTLGIRRVHGDVNLHDTPILILSSRKRYVKMRESLVRFRSLVHMYVNRKRYIKVQEVCFQRTIYLLSYLGDATFHAHINHSDFATFAPIVH